MLTGNTNNIPLRILAIDPGTDTLGISIIDVDLVASSLSLVQAYTFQASRWIDDLIDHPNWQHLDEKYLRLHRHSGHLLGLLDYYQPHWVVHESAFMGRFPKAYQGLTECILTLSNTVRTFNPTLPLTPISPMEVKVAIGGMKKEEVKVALSRVKDLNHLDTFLPYLDEHAVDATAIGYTKAKQILSESPWVY